MCSNMRYSAMVGLTLVRALTLVALELPPVQVRFGGSDGLMIPTRARRITTNECFVRASGQGGLGVC